MVSNHLMVGKTRMEMSLSWHDLKSLQFSFVMDPKNKHTLLGVDNLDLWFLVINEYVQFSIK